MSGDTCSKCGDALTIDYVCINCLQAEHRALTAENAKLRAEVDEHWKAMCAALTERDELRLDLARVTAERDGLVRAAQPLLDGFDGMCRRLRQAAAEVGVPTPRVEAAPIYDALRAAVAAVNP